MIRYDILGNYKLLMYDTPKIGIIGSRNVGSKELEQAIEVGVNAAASGYVVVTGMANGVDTWAMVGALRDKKYYKHIAVIPSIDYTGIPKNNHILLDEILHKEGLIIAPADPVKDNKSMYLRRNDLLLEVVDELIIVGQMGRGTYYTYLGALDKGINVTNI